jgi:hypothetical protein
MRIIQLRHRGLSYAQICSVLNAEQVPTPMGGTRWLKSHVDRLLHTRWVSTLIEELDSMPTCTRIPDNKARAEL